MNLDEYQREVLRHTDSGFLAHELVAMLGLGGHAGALLLAQERYLIEALAAQTSKRLVGRELGMVLRSAAVLARLNEADLGTVGRGNLAKVDRRARELGFPGIDRLPADNEELDFNKYQDLAAQTDQEISAGIDPLSLSVPMLGLAGEAGNVLVEEKKRFRGDSKIAGWNSFIAEELGDLLWYVATVARHIGLSLSEVAENDVQRLRRSSPGAPEYERDFDGDFPDVERLPRRLHLQFQERIVAGRATVTMTLIDATPNAFPDGPIQRGDDKFQGFEIGKPLGDEVNDNSRRVDAYRFHDAIHLGFLAVLGWSPNLRSLLHVKRKSVESVDEAEDGARAIFAEEGLAAILAKQAQASGYYETPNLVPEDLLDLISTVVEDLEVGALPYRAWREAISQGFTVLRQLDENGGGYVLADLDERRLQYSKFPFLGAAHS